MKFRLCEELFDIDNYDIDDRIRVLLQNKAEYIGYVTEITEDYIKIIDDNQEEQVIEAKNIDKIKTIDTKETFDMIEYFDSIERKLAETDDSIQESTKPKKIKPYKYPKNSYNMKQTDGMRKAKIGNPDPVKNMEIFNKNTTFNTVETPSSGSSTASADAGSAGGDGGGASA